MATRSVWSGGLGFGLVNIEVGLYKSTEDKMLHFNEFAYGSTDRVRYRKVNERTGEEVTQITKGFDLGGGEVVFLSDEELAAADPEKARTISILTFVDAKDVDPLFYRNGYYLAPKGEGSKRAYGLLMTALTKTKRAAIGSMVMRSKEYLVCIHPGQDGALVLQTLFFADEVRAPKTEVPNLPSTQSFTRGEVQLAVQLIESLSGDWDADAYHDTHRERVQEIIAAKAAGRVTVVAPAPPAPKVSDLIEALEASVQAAGLKKTPARKAAAKPHARAKEKAS